MIHSFDKHTNVYEVLLDEKYKALVDLETGEKIEGQRANQKIGFEVTIKTSYYKLFVLFKIKVFICHHLTIIYLVTSQQRVPVMGLFNSCK